ncbi:MAG: decarboxylating 6-phosphogluconate dehydrogenase [Candidatus Saccharimonadales bacterium]
MKIAIHGLGRMGMQIARKLAENNIDVIAHNRSPEPINEAVTYGALAAPTKQDVLTAFAGDQVVIWIMLPAAVVDAQLAEWLELMPTGSIIIDGGNSDYRLTKQRSLLVATKGSILLDVGTSGGIWGYDRGFSMMCGGDETAFKAVEPVLQQLALPTGNYQWFGASGAGHFVKMTHNAIEYGMMESLAEGYRMLHDGPYAEIDVTKAAEVWQHNSVITSWLNELCQSALKENPTLNGIDGFVAESGEARWTLETARDLSIPMPAIQSAFDVRIASQHGEVNFATKLLAAMRNKFGGHELNR